MSYIPDMEWMIEYTDEFGAWWDSLTESEQVDPTAPCMPLIPAEWPSC